jgi:hypothetical protein
LLSGLADAQHEANQLIATLLAALPAHLPHNLAGVYLRGSLATGDFRPESSDIDLLAVPYQRVNESEFARLLDLHNRIAQSDHTFAQRIEIAYVDRPALRRYQPGQHFPTLGQGETLRWTEHHANWILERWMVREQGIALRGPLPVSLIDPIPRPALREAVRARLQDWARWASDSHDPEWQLPRSHKFYVVETMCRALYTLATGEITSKPQSVAWARQTLPEPWRTLVERSQSWQMDNTVDDTLIAPVQGFVLWAAERGAA